MRDGSQRSGCTSGQSRSVHSSALPGGDPARGEDSISLVLLLEQPWPQVTSPGFNVGFLVFGFWFLRFCLILLLIANKYRLVLKELK